MIILEYIQLWPCVKYKNIEGIVYKCKWKRGHKVNEEYIIWGDRTYSKKAVFDVQVRDNIYHNIQYVHTTAQEASLRLSYSYYKERSGMVKFDPLPNHSIDQMYQRIFQVSPTKLSGILILLRHWIYIYTNIASLCAIYKWQNGR